MQGSLRFLLDAQSPKFFLFTGVNFLVELLCTPWQQRGEEYEQTERSYELCIDISIN